MQQPADTANHDAFSLVTDFEIRGDQERAIAELSEGLVRGDPHQVLLGVTGSGKTFTMAKVVAALNRPTLVMVHNKTLAAQLYQEFRRFFPHNAVEYFVSATTTTTSRKPTSRPPIRISRRKPRSMTRSTGCDFRLPVRSSNAGMC